MGHYNHKGKINAHSPRRRGIRKDKIMSKFAKIFDTDKGQVLVVQQSNDDGEPEIRVFCEPEGFGVCTSALSWKDTDQGWDKQQEVFNGITAEAALEIVEPIYIGLE